MDIPFSLFAALSAGLVLLYFYFHNKDRRVERYYIRHHKNIYVVLQIAYFVLIMSAVLNARFIVSSITGPYKDMLMKKAMAFIKAHKYRG